MHILPLKYARLSSAVGLMLITYMAHNSNLHLHFSKYLFLRLSTLKAFLNVKLKLKAFLLLCSMALSL